MQRIDPQLLDLRPSAASRWECEANLFDSIFETG